MLTREQYIRKWVRSLKLREVRLRVDYAKARNKFVREMVKEGEAKRFIVDSYERDLQAALTQSYQATIKQFRDLTITDIGLPEKKNTLFEALMMEWLARNALTKATTIASTDIDMVTEILIEAAAEGLGVESTGRLIRKITQQTPYRAATIARTEIHNAAVTAAMETTREQSREYGVTFNKEWMAVADGRTRPEHIDADGQTVAMDEKFNIGGEMMDAPGDPSGSAENVINCRCAIRMNEVISDDF